MVKYVIIGSVSEILQKTFQIHIEITNQVKTQVSVDETVLSSNLAIYSYTEYEIPLTKKYFS